MFTLVDVKAEDCTFDKSEQPSLYFRPTTQAAQLELPGCFLQDKAHPITLRVRKRGM